MSHNTSVDRSLHYSEVLKKLFPASIRVQHVGQWFHSCSGIEFGSDGTDHKIQDFRNDQKDYTKSLFRSQIIS